MSDVITTSSTMCKHINDLTDVALQCIFTQLSIKELVCAGRVCRRWLSIQKWTCDTRHSLTLIIADNIENIADGVSLILESMFRLCNEDFNDVDGRARLLKTLSNSRIDIPELNLNVERLLRTFPAVTHLHLALCFSHCNDSFKFLQPEQISAHANILKQLLTLLEHFGTQLISLRLCYRKKFDVFGDDDCELTLLELINRIGELPKLERLTIHLLKYIRGHLLRSSTIRLPVLSRLREFQFYSSNGVDFVWSALTQPQVLTNVNLCRVDIRNDWDDFDTLFNRMPSTSEQLFQKLTSIGPIDHRGFHALKQYLKTSGLICLELYLWLNSEILLEIFTILAQMPSLDVLCMYGKHDYQSEYIPLPQLTKIRFLKLDAEHEMNGQVDVAFLPSLHLTQTFPALKRLKIRFQVVDCRQKPEMSETIRIQVRQIAEKAKAVFRQMPHVDYIELKIYKTSFCFNRFSSYLVVQYHRYRYGPLQH